jgi:hypothetical protein
MPSQSYLKQKGQREPGPSFRICSFTTKGL